MSHRPIYLAKFRQASHQRAHFGIFVPNINHSPEDPNIKSAKVIGTVYHVVGAPMCGYIHEFKRNYDVYDGSDTEDLEKLVPLGSVDSRYIYEPTTTKFSKDDTPRAELDTIALRVPAPGLSKNFMAPVNDTTNRRCQEWTMDYIRALVSLKYIDPEAVDIVQAERDPPSHGIGLHSRQGAQGQT
ncbi:hypothetical protein F4818DRAFT_418984 [Hypoxylon cercidicola]|nr:hypothetical protein F4818DRAFT_418984 [Hypoxylon cercidicola]